MKEVERVVCVNGRENKSVKVIYYVKFLVLYIELLAHKQCAHCIQFFGKLVAIVSVLKQLLLFLELHTS